MLLRTINSSTSERLSVAASTARIRNGVRYESGSGHSCALFILVLIILLTILCPVVVYGSTPGLGMQPSTITSVKDVRRLKADVLSKTPNVHLRAVVTYYDSIVPNLFVQDSTGGIWVDLRGTSGNAPRPGQVLDLRGVAASGFTPYVAKAHWKVIGSSPAPKAVHLSYEQASTGVFDSRWVEMYGVVRSFVQEAEGNVLVIDVATPTGSFKVRIPDYRAGFPMRLVDAYVRFRGVCAATFNRRNQLVAIHLLMPGLDDSQVLDPAPGDPFEVTPAPIANIRQFSADLRDVHRVKVIGTVTARFPQQGLFLMDETGGLYAESQDGSPVQPGDKAEVIGFPAAGEYSPVLKSSSIRPTGKHRDITPADITGRLALQGGYDAQLVRISGTVRGQRQHLNLRTLVIESEDHITFETSLSAPSTQHWLAPVGSKVALTGVCSVKADENGNPAEFLIILRTPSDISILASPPWLNARRAVWMAFFLALITATIAGWVLILRNRLRRQTEIIRLKLKNEAQLEERYRRIFERNLTGLYIAHQDGSIIDCNDSCARILGFSSRTDLLANHDEAERIIRPFCDYPSTDHDEGKQIVNAERHFQRRDGTRGWVLSNARRVQQENGVGAAVEGGLVDITDRKTAEERIQFLAYYDSLTGLPNRTLLQDRLAKALASARRHHDKVAVLFLDLDRFKYLNDSLGHSYGDLLLQELATRLQTWAREQDTVSRLGGDEFIVVLSSIKEAADAAVAAERIAEGVTAEFNLQGHVFNTTCSIGISMFPDHGDDVETLIKHADSAMYSAKEGGRNTFRFFTQEMNAEVLERLTLENSLHTALDKNQLFLMYQPEIDVCTGMVTCCEALLRWRHPELGLIPPDKFVRIAENSGLIVPIGEWVLRTACAQANAWRKELAKSVAVAVNVSAVQFRQEGFCDMVGRVLQETGLDPSALELELTESLLLSNEDVMFQVLGRLQAMGLRLAIDDFGTGYSSLSYLKQFPVGKLKIDRSFIRDLAEDTDDGAITAAIINMARCLKLRVTAEGVETATQLSLLRAHECDEVQGFYFSKPLTADHLIERLRQGFIPAVVSDQTLPIHAGPDKCR